MSERRAHLFIAAALALAAVLLAAVALLNATVDPFQQYRLAPPGQAQYPRALQRYINPGLAKNADYDFVISGSSMMENYDLAEVNRICGARAINLATSAIAAFEQRKILETAFAHRHPKRVLLSLDFNSFAPAIDASLPEITDPLPLYLYDDDRLNDFRYLLSGSVTMRSLALLRGREIGRFSRDYDRAWSWVHEARFARDHAVAGLDPANINKRFRQGARTLAHMRASFETNFAALIERHPETEFNLVFPPYSILVWSDFVQRGQMELSLAFKRHVFERVGGLPNVRIFDMQWDRGITHDLNRYTDIYHFGPDINLRMLKSACGTETDYRVTVNSLPAFESQLRAQALAADPVRLIGGN